MKYRLTLITGIQLALVVFSGMILSSNTISADNKATATASVIVRSACVMQGTGTDSHTATLMPNTYSGASGSEYQNGIGKTTLTAICNDDNGFAIYAVGYTGNSYYSEEHTKLVGSNTGIAISTKAYAVSDTVSNWSMKLTKVTDSTISYNPQNLSVLSDTEGSFEVWHSVPSEFAKVAEYRATTGSSSTDATLGAVLETTYAAYIAQNQPADTYIGQVKYTLVHPSTQSAPAMYNDNINHISDVIYMQEFAKVSDEDRAAIVESMIPGQQYTIQDGRDGKTYTIAKYQVGVDDDLPIYDVWMTQNLDLDLETGRTYSNVDTDLGYNAITGMYEDASWTPMRSTYQTAANQIHEWCQGGTWNSNYGSCVANTTPESYDPGDLYWNLAFDSNGDWWNYLYTCDYSDLSSVTCDQSKNPLSNVTSATGVEQYHLGNYYNWAAALATNDVSGFVAEDYTDPVVVEQSICPAGWTLGRSGTEDNLGVAWYNYSHDHDYSFIDSNGNDVYDNNEDALWLSPFYYNLGGGFNGVLSQVGNGGASWLGMSSDVSSADIFSANGFNYGENLSDIGAGLQIRCILRPVVHTPVNPDVGRVDGIRIASLGY